MTTIAFRWGVMAADSLTVAGGDWICPYSTEKLHRLPDGTVAGFCGTLAEAMKFIKWLKDGEKGDEPMIVETTVIRMRKDGSLTIYESGASFDVETDFGAWGSGSPAANAAMYMGADAAKAIEIASLLDGSTGGKVITMKCEV